MLYKVFLDTNIYDGANYSFRNSQFSVLREDDLDDETKELIKNAIPDLITETLDTPIAIAKYQKYINGAGEILKNSMRQLLIDVVCENVKKNLF